MVSHRHVKCDTAPDRAGSVLPVLGQAGTKEQTHSRQTILPPDRSTTNTGLTTKGSPRTPSESNTSCAFCEGDLWYVASVLCDDMSKVPGGRMLPQQSWVPVPPKCRYYRRAMSVLFNSPNGWLFEFPNTTRASPFYFNIGIDFEVVNVYGASC